MAALKAAKRELRRHMRKTLTGMPMHSIGEQTQVALTALYSMPEYQAAKRISVYLSMPSGEIRTGSIVRNALESQKSVFVPYIFDLSGDASAEPESVMDMVSLRSMGDYESFEPDRWGIPTPSKDSIRERDSCLASPDDDGPAGADGERKIERLDMVVMPGMAFDCNLGRLGHGKGYYDVFLQRYRHSPKSSDGSSMPMPFLVGLALEQQVLPVGQKVPTDGRDWPLDALIVGDGRLLRARPDT